MCFFIPNSPFLRHPPEEWDSYRRINYFCVKYLSNKIICGDAKMMREEFFYLVKQNEKI